MCHTPSMYNQQSAYPAGSLNQVQSTNPGCTVKALSRHPIPLCSTPPSKSTLIACLLKSNSHSPKNTTRLLERCCFSTLSSACLDGVSSDTRWGSHLEVPPALSGGRSLTGLLIKLTYLFPSMRWQKTPTERWWSNPQGIVYRTNRRKMFSWDVSLSYKVRPKIISFNNWRLGTLYIISLKLLL